MKNNLSKVIVLTAIIFVLTISSSAFSQNVQTEPEISVSGISIGGNEETAKSMLQNYSPRYDNEFGMPKYFFYNSYGNQVMEVTAHSKERPYFIVAIEVFSVGHLYQKKHFQMKEVKSFISQSGFFIGYRPSVTSLLFAVPNTISPKDVIKKKGSPEADEKSEETRILRYRFNAENDSESASSGNKNEKIGIYSAEYRFYKNKLFRFKISVETALSANRSL